MQDSDSPRAPSSRSAVDVEDVVFSYGRARVVDRLSLSIPLGEIFGILGANGAGKTTVMRLLTGLLKPASGTVHLLGEAPTPKLAAQIGYMPQMNALYAELSARENVEFFARMLGLSDRKVRRDAVANSLHLVGLWERRNEVVIKLSGGMRQRLSLAIALVHDPSVLLLDEPTVGLDPEVRAGFWEHFRSLARSGTSLVISSHTMDDAAHCDRLVFLQGGRAIACGSPAELRSAANGKDATLEDAFLHFVRKARDE